MTKTYTIVRKELEKSKTNQEQNDLPHVKGKIYFETGDRVYLKNEAKTEGKNSPIDFLDQIE
jgi:hypothetical protein